MNVLLTGGSGFLGLPLQANLAERGYRLTSLSRTKSGREGATNYLPYERLDDLEPQDAVVNLAGESVAGLWTPRKRKAIYDSRIDTTRMLSEWISRIEPKPKVFLSGSAVGIYGDRGSEELTESADLTDRGGFLAKVCRDWEQSADTPGVRTVFLRTGQVFDPSAGYLGKVLPILRRLPIFVLGRNDSFVPWISREDWVDLILFVLDCEAITGPLNLSSPNPVSQRELTTTLARKLGKRIWGRIPEWMLRVGLGEFGSSIVASQRVIPQAALAAGFTFKDTVLDGYLAKAI